MTAQTMTVTDLTPLWDVLANLGWHEVPTDLSEIDENWCFNRLIEYCAGELVDLVYQADWEWMNESAQELREIWAEAHADDARHLAGRW
jgi:hypothetical protein